MDNQETLDNLESSINTETNKNDREKIRKIYDYFSDMREITRTPFNFFNNRTLKQFIDDSEKRFNSYVPSRASQRKEKWQANFFHPTTKNKVIALLAAVSQDIPDIRITAINERSQINMKIATVISDLVKYSYQKDDKEEKIFFEDLEASVKGTVVTYEGYLKTRIKRREIESYDIVTGEVSFKEKEVEINRGCDDIIIPLENFFIADPYERNIQKQPRLIWVSYLSKEDFAFEFGQFKKFKYVRTKGQLLDKDIQKTFFFEDWKDRVKNDQIEVIRFFSKFLDTYVVIANGILMLDAPLLLQKGDEKQYPFSKTIFEPFSSSFFWGNSLPNKLLGEQDVISSLYNMSLDKTYKSMVPNLLISNQNKDDFDLDDEENSLDTKIYVQDINQVKELQLSGLTQSEIRMIDLISRGLDLSSVDSNQQGVTGKGVTAREVVIANEHARKMKGIFFMFITNLWLQKINLRISNILTHYTTDFVSVIAGQKQSKLFNKFVIENTTLSSGKKGNKGIIIAKTKKDLPTQKEIDTNVEEYSQINPDTAYEEVAITSDYFKNWNYVVKVISESLFQDDSSFSVSKNEDKLKVIATLFPTYFQKNQAKLFRDTMNSYGEDADEYDIEEQQPPEQQIEGQQSTGNELPTNAQGPQNASEQIDIKLPNLPTTMQ